MVRFKRKSVFKLLAASVFMTIVVLGGGIMFLSKSAITVQSFSLKTDKLIYRSDEHPDFSLKAKVISRSNFWDRLKKQVLAEGAPRTQVLYDGQPVDMPVSLTATSSGFYNVNLVPQNSIKPGKYTLKATINASAGPKTQQQNFAWGVLAVNTDKATYLPSETAKIQMAVLSSSGHTLCSAPLSLTVTAPDGSQSQPGVHASELCKGDTYITEPDYTASFTVGGAGTYKMLLRLSDSDYTLSDTFEVKAAVPFDIIRAGPSRIYPPANYPMVFKVHANQDFKGTVADTLPKDYKITDNGGGKIARAGDYQSISWQVDWKAGQDYSLNYHFKAPPDSPAFYFIGPLEFKDNSGAGIYKEARRWQIAGDATFPQTSSLTSFTGADENPLSEGGAWAGPWEATSPQMRRIGNAAKGAASNAKSYRTDVSAVNTEAYMDVTTLPTSGAGAIVALRIQNPGNTSTATAYIWVYIVGTGFRWYTLTNGHTFVNIGNATFTPHTLAAGESIGASVIGSTITGYYKSGGTWTQVDSRTDTTVTGAGTIGIGADESVNTVLDNFGGGGLPATGPLGSPILSTFTGADVSPATGWAASGTSSNLNGVQRVSNQAKGTAANAFWAGYYTAATYGPDAEAFLTDSVQDSNLWLDLRLQQVGSTSTVDGYEVERIKVAGAGNDTVKFWRMDNGVGAQIGSTITQEFATGDGLGASIVGSILKAYIYTAGAWTQIGSSYDTSADTPVYSSAGNIGAGGHANAGNTGDIFDNFGGGTVSSGAPTTDQLLRGGIFFNNGVKTGAFWAS